MKKKYNSSYREIGERLKTLRKEWRLNRQQMAQRIGVSYDSYLKYEKGKVFSNPPAMEKLLTEHGFSMDWFLFGIGPRDFVNKVDKDVLVKDVTEPLEKTIGRLLEENSHLLKEAKKQSELIDQLKTELGTETERNNSLKEELKNEMSVSSQVPEMSEDIKELVLNMNRNDLLRYEILIRFKRFQAQENV